MYQYQCQILFKMILKNFPNIKNDHVINLVHIGLVEEGEKKVYSQLRTKFRDQKEK